MLTAIVLRILWVAYVNVDPSDGRFDDSVFYQRVALALADRASYLDPYGRGPTAQWPPAYPAALAVLYKLFGFHLLLAKGLNIAFGAVTVVLAYILARRVFDWRVASLGAFFLAFFPGQIFFATIVYAETMFAAVFLLVLVLALVWTLEGDRSRWWQVLLIGFLIGVAALVRAEGIFLAFVLVGLWALLVRPWRTVGRYAVMLAIGVVLALTPWTVRNAVEFHEFIPIRTNSVNAVARAIDVEFDGPVVVGESEPRSIREGLQYQLTHPWRVVATAAIKVGRLYRHDYSGIRFVLKNPISEFDRDEQPLTEREEMFWRGLTDRYFYAASAAAVVAIVLAVLRRNRASLVIIAAIFGWTFFFSFFTPVTRYHFPLMPLFAVLSASVLVLVWDWAKVGWRLQLIRAKVLRQDIPEIR